VVGHGEPYHYVRTVLEGSTPPTATFCWWGRTTPPGPCRPWRPAAYLRLENWARERWPMAQEVVYKWTGQVCRRGTPCLRS